MRFQENKLTAYRRHQPPCEQTRTTQLDCQCPIWAHGRVRGKLFRRALATRSLAQAKKKIQLVLDGTLEALAQAEEPAQKTQAAPEIEDAIEDYLRYCEVNKRLRRSSLKSYRTTLEAFHDYCSKRSYRRFDQLDLNVLERFQASRNTAPGTMVKQMSHLSGFLNRAVKLGWMTANPAREVELPQVEGVSTLPFAEGEAEAILAACSRLGEGQVHGYGLLTADQLDDVRRHARALVLMLLTTGLRISDVIGLERSRIYTDHKGVRRLRLRTQKTGVLMTLMLPKQTAAALDSLPRVSDRLYFWKGGSEAQFAVQCDAARRVIKRVGALAGVEDAKPHRFRDTWAKVALLDGKSLRTVQLVLGHKSILTTERHYSHFVAEHQKLIDDAVGTVAERLLA